MEKTVPILPTNVQLKAFRKEILKRYYAPALGIDCRFLSLSLGICERSCRYYLKELEREGALENNKEYR